MTAIFSYLPFLYISLSPLGICSNSIVNSNGQKLVDLADDEQWWKYFK